MARPSPDHNTLHLALTTGQGTNSHPSHLHSHVPLHLETIMSLVKALCHSLLSMAICWSFCHKV
jgi:hypothetical protein